MIFWNTRRVVRTASTVRVRKPTTRQAIGRWKHYRAHLEPLFQVLGHFAQPEVLQDGSSTLVVPK
jgi:hypothetical protein